jgi:PIN domain nuclease of toxin-antitoxin system
VILLDAYGLIAFLAGENAGSSVRAILREGDAGIGAVNLAETIDVMVRRRGVPAAALRQTLEPLLDSTLATIALEPHHAWRAGELRASHYHRTNRPISAADCALLAIAGDTDSVATADVHLLAVAEAEGVPTVRLPTKRS